MAFAKRWTIALVMTGAAAAASGVAFAGEDSTERWYGFGPAFWETPCGLKCFNPDSTGQRGPTSQP